MAFKSGVRGHKGSRSSGAGFGARQHDLATRCFFKIRQNCVHFEKGVLPSCFGDGFGASGQGSEPAAMRALGLAAVLLGLLRGAAPWLRPHAGGPPGERASAPRSPRPPPGCGLAGSRGKYGRSADVFWPRNGRIPVLCSCGGLARPPVCLCAGPPLRMCALGCVVIPQVRTQRARALSTAVHGADTLMVWSSVRMPRLHTPAFSGGPLPPRPHRAAAKKTIERMRGRGFSDHKDVPASAVRPSRSARAWGVRTLEGRAVARTKSSLSNPASALSFCRPSP